MYTISSRDQARNEIEKVYTMDKAMAQMKKITKNVRDVLKESDRKITNQRTNLSELTKDLSVQLQQSIDVTNVRGKLGV